jgi:hypothetical protein
MSICELIDTFPTFLTCWAKAQLAPLDGQIEDWATGYMAPWPELLQKVKEDYSKQGLEWRHIARTKVFPFLSERLPAMQIAHDNLVELCTPTYSRAQRVLGFESDVTMVIYVGIGTGAGWLTSFRGSPGILFGLETVAELGWSDRETIVGLISHEIGHLVHRQRRAKDGDATGSGAWWQLYEEGFAQRCESRILGKDTWHQAGKSEDWISWCKSHQGWLAAEFLKAVDAGGPIAPFFGSWYDVKGKIETGYFLGHEAIRELEGTLGFEEIARLDNIERFMKPILKNMAGG